MSFLDRIRACNTADLAPYRPFVVDGHEVGLVKLELLERLRAFPETFAFEDGALRLANEIEDPTERTRAVETVLLNLRDDGLIPHWRDEPYPVTTGFGQKAVFTIERAAAAMFGVRAFGVHLNGFVRDGKDFAMWIGRRAKDRPVCPGKLDQIVAGGQPAGLSLEENLVKECGEEADISPALAAMSVPVGAVSYVMERPEGLRRDVLFNFDLELPADFVPRNTDGELDGFELWPMDQLVETVERTDDFKFNCSLVIIDFLIRHGIIPPDHPDYLDIQKGLRAF